jgi:hypothetical protein
MELKTTLVAATDFGLNDSKYEQRTFVFDPKERKSFALLQEAYFRYVSSKSEFVIGREEFQSPMIDADDYYMLADTFELIRYRYKASKQSVYNIGYIKKMAGVWDSGANGTKFESMSKTSFIDDRDKARIGDKGVYFLSVDYDNARHTNIRIWDYYAKDLYNTLFFQYQYKTLYNSVFYEGGVQIIDFKNVGKLKDAVSKKQAISSAENLWARRG